MEDQPVETQPTQQVQGLDLDNLPTVTHNWVQRGDKVSCEGAMHPHHSHFLIKRHRGYDAPHNHESEQESAKCFRCHWRKRLAKGGTLPSHIN